MDSLYSRYASALLSIAEEKNQIDAYRNKIKMWRKLISENEELLHLLSSCFIEKDDKENIIDEIFKEEDEEIKNFVKIVNNNKRTNELLKIFDEFILEANERLGIKDGIVYSIDTLSKEQMESIRSKLSLRLGCEVELQNVIDKRLLGGVKIVVEDKIFDGSIKNKLEKLKESLISGGK